MKEKIDSAENLKAFTIKVEGVLANGEKISPETLSIDKFATLFDKFKKLVEVAIVESDNGEYLVNFKYINGSAVFVSDIPSSSHDFIQAEIREIEAGHPLNAKASEVSRILLDLKRFSTNFGKKVEITLGSEEKSYLKINTETQFNQLKETIVDSEKIIYGKLFSVGGKSTPNVHLAPEKEKEVIVNVSEYEARDLANNLYNEIGIKTSIKQNLLDGEVISAKYISLIPYSRIIDEEKLKRDRKIGKEAWKGINAVEWEKAERSE